MGDEVAGVKSDSVLSDNSGEMYWSPELEGGYMELESVELVLGELEYSVCGGVGGGMYTLAA